MNINQALQRAKKIAKERREFAYVIYEAGIVSVATQQDMETIFACVEPYMAVDPYGTVN